MVFSTANTTTVIARNEVTRQSIAANVGARNDKAPTLPKGTNELTKSNNAIITMPYTA